MECLFCKIIDNEMSSYTLYEDEIVKVILDAYPDTDGHTLIIPKKHFDTYQDLDYETLNHIFEVSKKIKDLLMKKLNANAITLLVNYGDSQIVKHFHLHLLPNFKVAPASKKIADIHAILTK